MSAVTRDHKITPLFVSTAPIYRSLAAMGRLRKVGIPFSGVQRVKLQRTQSRRRTDGQTHRVRDERTDARTNGGDGRTNRR